MLIPPSDDPRDLASEARHGGRVILNQNYYNSQGWRSGLEDDPDYVPQLARIMSGRGAPPRYIQEWREPGWPIYRAALHAGLYSALTDVKEWLVEFYPDTHILNMVSDALSTSQRTSPDT